MDRAGLTIQRRGAGGKSAKPTERGAGSSQTWVWAARGRGASAAASRIAPWRRQPGNPGGMPGQPPVKARARATGQEPQRWAGTPRHPPCPSAPAAPPGPRRRRRPTRPAARRPAPRRRPSWQQALPSAADPWPPRRRRRRPSWQQAWPSAADPWPPRRHRRPPPPWRRAAAAAARPTWPRGRRPPPRSEHCPVTRTHTIHKRWVQRCAHPAYSTQSHTATHSVHSTHRKTPTNNTRGAGR
jgi:hypothetical protein